MGGVSVLGAIVLVVAVALSVMSYPSCTIFSGRSWHYDLTHTVVQDYGLGTIGDVSLTDITLRQIAAVHFEVSQLFYKATGPWPNKKASKDEYDYIIIGAGTAGSTLAARLSEDPAVSILLLEAGPVDKHMFVEAPLASPFLQGTERDWGIEIEPQDGACRSINCVKHAEHHGKSGCCRWPMGKGLGGGSTINYMVLRPLCPRFPDSHAECSCANRAKHFRLSRCEHRRTCAAIRRTTTSGRIWERRVGTTLRCSPGPSPARDPPNLLLLRHSH